MPAQTVIKIRRDTSTNWESVNPTLAAGEIAFETDTNKIKVGDGSTVWASLDYASGAGTAAEITYDNADAELIANTVKGALDELSLTKADVSQLSTNLSVFATTAASDIGGYSALVSTIEDPDFDTTAVDVTTGAINADNQLIASLAADAGLFEGQVDPITVTTIGNIRKTSGNQNQSASFYFEVYVRNSGGTETLVGTSDDTGEVNPTNLNEYQEFSASAFVSFGTVGATDRIVIKFYGNVADGAGAEYDFQFGGSNPVRTLIPVPANVVVVHEASGVTVDTTNFNGNLSGSDDTVQAALETLDDLEITAGVITSDSAPSSPSNGDLWWESDTGILFIYYDNFWVQAVAGVIGPQGEPGVVAATSPITYDSGTQTVGIDESAINVDQDQVTGLASGTSGYSAVSDGSVLSYQPLSHNYIINGAFDIWQRGDTFSQATEAFGADRYYHQASGASYTITRQPFSAGDLEVAGFGQAEYFYRATVTTNDNFFIPIAQRIEDVRTLAGETATLSFWAKGTNPGGGQVFTRVAQVFGSGGSSSTLPLSTGFTLTSSWQRFEFTFDIDSLSGKTIEDGNYLSWFISTLGDTSTDAWELDIWGVQLEAGSIATPFKRNANNIQGELAACQRYYQFCEPERLFGISNSTTSGLLNGYLPTTMRASPTVTLRSGNEVTINFFGVGQSTSTSFVFGGYPSTFNLNVNSLSPARQTATPLNAIITGFNLNAELL